MIKILYIPTGEYLKWYAENGSLGTTDLTKTHFISIEQTIYNLTTSAYGASSYWIKTNNIVKFPLVREELEIIYD